MTASLFARAASRRHLELFRACRQQPAGRRHRSSGPTPTSTTTTTTSPGRPTKAANKKAEEDPIPVPNTVGPLPIWQRLGPLTRAGQAYGRAQRRRPWAMQLASTLVIYLCADISAQRMNGEEGEGHDLRRTARSLAIGGMSSIPSYLWFMWLSRSFNYPASHTLSIAVKVAVNQAVFTPTFNTYFFGAQALLAGDTVAEAWERVRCTVPTSCVNSLKLWPAVTALSFAYVPLEYRSVFAGVVAVGWQTYLSFLNRQAERREDGEKAAAAAAEAAVRAGVRAE